MKNKYTLPVTFTIRFDKTDRNTYLLSTRQILPLPRETAFSFFEKPENLSEITPDWLNLRFDNKGMQSRTFKGAEYDYSIRWLAVTMRWHTRISEYRPPEMFTDVQVSGPYALWTHLHTFETVIEGTLIRDFVTYRVPFGFLGKILHSMIIKKQLQDIFSYRAVRIAAWADETFQRKD
ncbi:MAG: SRPBCC family protein [Nitrospirota bacterium]